MYEYEFKVRDWHLEILIAYLIETCTIPFSLVADKELAPLGFLGRAKLS